MANNDLRTRKPAAGASPVLAWEAMTDLLLDQPLCPSNCCLCQAGAALMKKVTGPGGCCAQPQGQRPRPTFQSRLEVKSRGLGSTFWL